MRQVGLALLNYANDNHGYMPPNGGWSIDLSALSGAVTPWNPPTPVPVLDLRGLREISRQYKSHHVPVALRGMAPLVNGEQTVYWWGWYGQPASLWNSVGSLIPWRIGYTYMWSTSNVCFQQNYGRPAHRPRRLESSGVSRL